MFCITESVPLLNLKLKRFLFQKACKNLLNKLPQIESQAGEKCSINSSKNQNPHAIRTMTKSRQKMCEFEMNNIIAGIKLTEQFYRYVLSSKMKNLFFRAVE